MVWPLRRAGFRAILVSLVIASCLGCSKSEAPASKDVVGRVLDNDGRPFPRSVLVTAQENGPRNVGTQTDPEGRFTLRDLEPGPYTLSFRDPKKPGTPADLVVRSLAKRGGAAALYVIAVTVEPGSGQQDVGTWLAEDSLSNEKRVHETLGPHCDRAFADKAVTVPEQAIPLELAREDYDGRWHYSPQLQGIPQLLTAKVAAICLSKSQTEAGTFIPPATDYTRSSAPGYDYSWRVVIVLRDGKRLSESFYEGAPREAQVRRGYALTDQDANLRTRLSQWLRQALGETGQKP